MGAGSAAHEMFDGRVRAVDPSAHQGGPCPVAGRAGRWQAPVARRSSPWRHQNLATTGRLSTTGLGGATQSGAETVR